jgi:hypothetical protein
MQTQEAKVFKRQPAVRQPYMAPKLTRYGRVQDATGASGGRIKGGTAQEASGGQRARS